MDAAYVQKTVASKLSKAEQTEPKLCPHGRAHMIGGTCECGWCWHCAKREKAPRRGPDSPFGAEQLPETVADITIAFAYHNARIVRLERIGVVALAFLFAALITLGFIVAR